VLKFVLSVTVVFVPEIFRLCIFVGKWHSTRQSWAWRISWDYS